MLSDDITNAAGTGVRLTGGVISGAVRGLLWGAALAIVIGIGVAAWPALAGAGGAFALFGGGQFLAGLTATGSALAGGAASLFGMTTLFGVPAAAAATVGSAAVAPTLIATGAKIGAVTLGTTSLIPSVQEWPGIFKKGVAVPSQMVQYTKDVAHAAAPNLTQEQDNPYFEEGKGARLMNRGDAASQGAGATR